MKSAVAIVAAMLFAIGVWVAMPAGAGQGNGSSQYIAPTANTSIPVYDTAWQMFVLADPADADEYFRALRDNGFSGAWSALAHHAPATIAHPFFGGGTVANFDAQGNIVFTPEYIAHVRSILDAADRYGMKVGVVAAWQNLYLPGGRSDDGHPISDTVRGRLDTSNSYAYGRQMVEAFGDHPAVSAWVFGGDAGSNNTEANIQVWRNMAAGVHDAGSTIDITYHTPSAFFDQLNYAGEPWLDFISPETGHNTTPQEIEDQLIIAGNEYQIPVWQGEPRYFNLNFTWVIERFRNPQVADVRADAIAARNAGVAGYLYGDAGRWNWCGGFGDSTPCDRNNISASFGAGERAVIEVFAATTQPPPTTTTPPGSGGSSTFLVEGRALGGNVRLTVRAAGAFVGTINFASGVSVESIALPAGAAWEDIQIAFADNGQTDIVFNNFSLSGDVRSMTDSDVLASGQWNGSNCSMLGPSIGNTIHCSGFVEFLPGSVVTPPTTANCANIQPTIVWGPGAVATQGDDVILGTPGPDVIVGLGGNDTICGLGGDDTINAGPGNDFVDAGNGDDTVFGLDGDDTINAGPGNDTIISGNGNDNITGSDGNDTLNGGNGNDTLLGNNGNDTLFGQTGDDTLNGGDGNDTLLGFAGQDTIFGQTGDDIINGGPDDDNLSGGQDDDTIFGLTGNDTLNGNAGNDTLFGQAGNDTLNGGPGNDQLAGNEDNDILTDPSGNNTLNGGAGNDQLTGGTGVDQMFGDGNLTQAGDDIIDGGLGSDTLIGFAGNDTINSQDGGTTDTVNGGPDTDTCNTDTIDTVFNCP